MSTFFKPETKQRATAAIQKVEGVSSAEIVVALRKSSGSYRHADYLFGFLLALSTFAATILAPATFPPRAAALDLALMFVIGSLICAAITPLRSLLAGGRLKQANVHMAARAAFYDMGVSKTTGRSGILVYGSLLERRVEVVPDVGIDAAGMGEEWGRAVHELQNSLLAGSPDRFIAAIEALGPVLAKRHPRAADDVNELSDEVSAS